MILKLKKKTLKNEVLTYNILFFQRCHLWNQYDGPRTCSYDVLQPREETCLCHLPRSCISHSCSKVGIFFCCLNKQHITTNHIYYLFRQIKIGINPIKKEATLFVSKPEYQNPWMFFVHSQVSVTARSNKLDGQFPGIYLYCIVLLVALTDN